MTLSKYSGGMDEGTYTVATNKIIDALNDINLISSYASFSDNTALQQIISETSEQVITFDTVEASVGITLVNNSRITLPSVGSYLLVFSALGYTSSNQEQYIDIWLKKNGNTPVVRSSTRVTIPAQGHYTPMAVSIIVDATVIGDYYQLMMCGSSGGGENQTGIATLAGSASEPVRPAAPAIIVTINKISI